MANEPSWWNNKYGVGQPSWSAILPEDAEDPPSGSYFPLKRRYAKFIPRYLTYTEWKAILNKKGISHTGITYPETGVPNNTNVIGFMRVHGKRWHTGIDLRGRIGDVIYACEDGEIVRIREFFRGTYCIFVKCTSGIVINYGEVTKDSWLKYGFDEKDKVDAGTTTVTNYKVKAGQPFTEVGRQNTGGHCLHFEIYKGSIIGTWTNTKLVGNQVWYQNTSNPANTTPPSHLLNPTNYLIKLLGQDTPENTRPKEIESKVECR